MSDWKCATYSVTALRLSNKYILFRIGKYYHSMMPLFRQERCTLWAPIRCHADFTSRERQHRLAQHDIMYPSEWILFLLENASRDKLRAWEIVVYFSSGNIIVHFIIVYFFVNCSQFHQINNDWWMKQNQAHNIWWYYVL